MTSVPVAAALVAACAIPCAVAARHARGPAGAWGWWGVALLAAAASGSADPLETALWRVDGTIIGTTCSAPVRSPAASDRARP